MCYIVYHVRSTVIMKSFESKSSAKRSATCMNRNSGSNEYAFAEESNYFDNVLNKWQQQSLA